MSAHYKHKHVLALRDVDGLGEFQNRVPRNIPYFQLREIK
jgi:hypothetical protein